MPVSIHIQTTESMSAADVTIEHDPNNLVDAAQVQIATDRLAQLGFVLRKCVTTMVLDKPGTGKYQRWTPAESAENLAALKRAADEMGTPLRIVVLTELNAPVEE